MKKIITILISVFLLLSFVGCSNRPKNGKTPYIQDGYWYIDGVNTGVKAEGVDGKDGQNGTDEKDGTLAGDNQGLIFYPQDDGTYVVSGGNAKYMKNIIIPEKYRGGDVVAIEEDAFKNFVTLETIVIPNGVKKIGTGIFAGCANLATVSMPCYKDTPRFSHLCIDHSTDSLLETDTIPKPPITTIHFTGGNSIPDYMLDLPLPLKTLTIADSITSIGQYAFDGCPDSLFEEENGIKYIGKWAVGCTSSNFALRNNTIGIASGALIAQDNLYDENITEFVIPASVKHLPQASLLISPFIQSYKVDEGNSEYCAVDGVVYSKDMQTLVQYPIAKAQEHFEIPQNVKAIDSFAFYSCEQLQNVTLPNGLIKIHPNAFAESRLTSITIPSSVTTIENGAFASCTSLKNFTLYSKTLSICEDAFSWCYSLSDIHFDGTISEWNNIEKAEKWNYCVDTFTVHCSDGDLQLEGWDYPADYH